MQELKGNIIFAGEGALLYKDQIMDIMKGRALIASPDKMVPSPANVAMLGLSKVVNSEYAGVSETVPFYIRKSEAEVKWSEKK